MRGDAERVRRELRRVRGHTRRPRLPPCALAPPPAPSSAAACW
jgi:hypothetical protein